MSERAGQQPEHGTPASDQPAPLEALGHRRAWPPMKPPWYRRLGPALLDFGKLVWSALLLFEAWAVRYFRTHAPVLKRTLVPFILLATLLYIRHPATNYIFDEQEALLANPYVNAQQKLTYWDAIHRDFWGLPPNASIGSYRPLPDLLWRATWVVSEHPFFHHLYNLLLHGLNGALLSSFAYAVTRRHLFGWLAGALFVASAIITEAVSGIVGIADVLGGLGAILALCALRLPGWAMPMGVFGACLLGLFSKESALVCVPLIPVAALLTAPALHPRQPARFARFGLSLVAALGAFILYVELRKQWFPSPLPSELTEALPADASDMQQLYRDLLVWFHQAPLPKDPLNNPLSKADFPHRLAGALRVYWRGCLQVLWPTHLSGDYSFPQEPIPETTDGWETLAGGAMMIGPLALALGMWIVALKRELQDRKRLLPAGELGEALRGAFVEAARAGRRLQQQAPLLQLPASSWRKRPLSIGVALLVLSLAGLGVEVWLATDRGSTAVANTWPLLIALLVTALGFIVTGWRSTAQPMDSAGPWPLRHALWWMVPLGLVWMVVSYFPHSNIPVVLPTVRAERFWYFPVIGTALCLAMLFSWLHDKLYNYRLRTLGHHTMTVGACLIWAFMLLQCLCAYRHSTHYRDDLAFWYATKNAVPNSAKAHLNYSVMVGARGDLHTRLAESHIARQLAPKWAMAHIYTGDTLCRLHRAHEAWPHYAEGFDIGPNDRSLISLALQCMYDENILLSYDKQLRDIAAKHPGSWIAYLAVDTLDNHEKYNGVDPKYRPRSYNQKAKDDEDGESSGSASSEGDSTAIAEETTTIEVTVSGEPSAETGSADAGVGVVKAPGPSEGAGTAEGAGTGSAQEGGSK